MDNQIHYGRKRSGIKRELKKVIGSWLDTIKDESVKSAALEDVIITGGSIASMLLGDPVNDYDVYFRTKETALKVAQYYVVKFNENNKLKTGEGVSDCSPYVKEETLVNIKGETEERICIFIKSSGVAGEDQSQYEYFESKTEDETIEFSESLINKQKDNGELYRPVFMSQNAITLSHKMQIIIRFYGEPDEIHSNYDYIHAMCYYDYSNNELKLPAEALEALLSRTLIYKGSLYPIASIFRAKKFIERGWRITAGQLLKIMWQISEINLKDETILREQLTGVDMAYMHELIEALKGIDEDKINSTYVGAIIDKIFD